MKWKVLTKFRNEERMVLLIFVLECLWFFFFKQQLDFFISPLIFMLFPVLLFKYLIHKRELFEPTLQSVGKPVSLIHLLPVILVLFILAIRAQYMFGSNPIDATKSDIIPLIRDIYVNRFFNGDNVYAPYSGFNYGTFTPNYMPLHWLPFVIANLFGFDYRWVGLGFFLIPLFVLQYHIYRSETSLLHFYCKSALYPLILTLILFKQTKEILFTVEILISAYYIFLGISLFSNKIFARPIGVILTLLSRYSALFWMPLLAAESWVQDKKKFFYQVLILLVGLVFLYFMPFVLQTPAMLTSGANLWIDAALNEWDGQHWQNPGDLPFQLFQGNGFASWFYLWWPGSLPQKIVSLKNVMIGLTFTSMLVLLVWQLKHKAYSPLFLLLSLKVVLSVFYAFVIVPYEYLFWVPIFLTPLCFIFMNPQTSTESVTEINS